MSRPSSTDAREPRLIAAEKAGQVQHIRYRLSWRRKVETIATALLLWLLLPLLTGCRASHADADTSVLRVGDQKGGIQALLTAAGELDDVPYKIEWALFPAASPLLEALGANAIDLGGVGAAPFAFAYASGVKIKAVYAYRPEGPDVGKASAILVRPDSPIRTLADLKGRRLATIKGSAGQDLALKLLQKAGLKPADVQWVYLNNGEAKAALAAGSIDAWSTWGSYVGIAVIEDKNRIVADGSQVETGAGFYAATDSAIGAKRSLLNDFLARVARARSWARSHPDDYAKVLARETKLPFEIAKFAVSSYLGSSVPIDKGLVDEQKAVFERYRAAGIVKEVPDVDGGYDPSFNSAISAAARSEP